MGSSRHIGVEIVDDEIAHEDNESFKVDFDLVNRVGARNGAIPQTMVVIIAHYEEVNSVPHSLLHSTPPSTSPSFANYNMYICSVYFCLGWLF